MKILYIIPILAFLFAGCTSASLTVTSASTPSPTVIPKAVSRYSTSTPKPTATIFFRMNKPTHTPTSSDPKQVMDVRLKEPCFFHDTFSTKNPIAISPQKKWTMFICESEKPEDGLVAQFVNLDGSKIWTVSYNDVYIKPYHKDIPDSDSDVRDRMFFSFDWTIKEDFVYLPVHFRPALPYDYFGQVHGVFRLDLTTGKTSPVLMPNQGPDMPRLYSYLFSPSKTSVAFIDNSVSPLTVTVLDLITGTAKKLDLPSRFTDGGHMFWSSNEKFLLVSLLDENAQLQNEYALILCDLSKLNYGTLLEGNDGIFSPTIWRDENTLIVDVVYSPRSYDVNILTREVQELPRR